MTMPERVTRVAVVGAASQIGQALLPRLRAQGQTVSAIGRETSLPGTPPVHLFDALQGRFTPDIGRVDALVSLAPLPVIGQVLDMAQILHVRRVIAFGSTGRFSKAGSSSALEQDFVAQQTQAETLFATRCAALGIAWTLLRPTMVYGAGSDLSISFIAAMVDRYHFFPIPWFARGLRQPVHVDDLAWACAALLDCPPSHGQAYNLGGAEVIAFPDLVRRVFTARNRRPVLLPIPLSVYRLLLLAGRRRIGADYLRPEMVDRMYQDLLADNTPAARDFGYAPRAFVPGRS